MSETLVPVEQRQARRKPVNGIIEVRNAINGRPLGRLGNISVSGLMLICAQPPQVQAIHQVRFALPDDAGALAWIEAGIEVLWISPTAHPGQYWAGSRIIAISPAHTARIAAWLD